ncbi:PilZ domain-containing protein [Chondromyces apiculatus]|uniref:PilZ domain-containing protein n=1 Tax=Chondromyces apiculatus DSM 436 TaxID=1192034 RepID=A0A017TF30_9BACT|nr:PilZ domain-containing protein [Chondromyces apiculatus]EYF07507.1 Hypothetical protein CAP_0260 [Chondromyces apiculatus DSM 436]
MTGRSEGNGDAGERRSGAGRRVHFEALVAVGEAAGGSGFEAESVDVSPDGMRLRAAYLPEVGDRLLCRFDGPGGEIAVEGEVCWRRDESRGGEFGLRFAGLDPASSEAVRALVSGLGGTSKPMGGGRSVAPGTPAAAPSDGPGRGARVRLHIEGLGSPMKARVRAGEDGALEVGSNLEFLKVGRSLALEDVERGARREAFVDAVRVEVDPGSSIPQLVVTLSYEPTTSEAARAAGSPRAATPRGSRGSSATASGAALPAAAAVSGASVALASAAAASAAPAAGGAGAAGTSPARTRSTPAPAPAPALDESPAARATEPTLSSARHPQEVRRDLEAAQESDASPSAEASEQDRGEAEDVVAGQDGEAEAGPSSEAAAEEPGSGRGARLRDVGEKAAAVGRAVAGRVGPALSGATDRARGAMGGLLARIREKRAERGGVSEVSEVKKGSEPRRMTAPPPTGALRTEGRRLVRDDGAASDEAAAAEEATARPRVNKKAAALGSFLGLAAVLVVFGAARLAGLGKGPEGTQATAALPAGARSAEALAALPAPGAMPVPTAEGTLTANVPLFGATPLSTTEPVLPSAPPVADLGSGALDPLAEAAANAAGNAELEAGDEGGEEPTATGDGKAWGQGEVKNPIVLKLKMDGDIERLTGAAGPMGFTVSLPDRRALSSGSGLARKDKRIASIRVVNTPQGAEVSLQFKDGVPAYVAKSNGDRLEIALGNDSAPKKVASKSKAKKGKKGKDDAKKKGGKGKSH